MPLPGLPARPAAPQGSLCLSNQNNSFLKYGEKPRCIDIRHNNLHSFSWSIAHIPPVCAPRRRGIGAPREKAPQPKPHPRQLWDACAALGLEPGRAAMVGAEELHEAGAVVVLPDAGQVLGFLTEDH